MKTGRQKLNPMANGVFPVTIVFPADNPILNSPLLLIAALMDVCNSWPAYISPTRVVAMSPTQRMDWKINGIPEMLIAVLFSGIVVLMLALILNRNSKFAQ